MRWSDEELEALIADFDDERSVSISRSHMLNLALDLRDARKELAYVDSIYPALRIVGRSEIDWGRKL